MKSELACVIGQTVLPPLALQIVNDLAGRGLPNINDSTALQQLNSQFRMHPRPPSELLG